MVCHCPAGPHAKMSDLLAGKELVLLVGFYI